MSRRQHTRLILSVEVPIPQGWTQAKTIEFVRQLVCQEHETVIKSNRPSVWGLSAIVKLQRKETTYL